MEPPVYQSASKEQPMAIPNYRRGETVKRLTGTPQEREQELLRELTLARKALADITALAWRSEERRAMCAETFNTIALDRILERARGALAENTE